MDSVLLLLSAFSGLAAAFVGSAVWATRPQPVTNKRLMRHDGVRQPLRR